MTDETFDLTLFELELNDAPDVTLVDIIKDEAEERGMSRPFLGLADDDQLYWIKQPVSAYRKLVVVEQIVAGCAEYLNASAMPTARVLIPDALDGHKLRSGVVLEACIAHGSRHLEAAQPRKDWKPSYRKNDHNAKRHASYLALCEWCYGCDHQWLYDLADDFATYSHDHGLFLNFDWDLQTLKAKLHEPFTHDFELVGLSLPELNRLADTLHKTTAANTISICSRVPASWGVDKTTLEFMAWFLLQRAWLAANKLQQILEGLE